MTTITRVSTAVAAAGLVLLLHAAAQADAVDDILNGNLAWRAAHPLTKCRLREIGGDGAPVGTYYLDLRTGPAGNPAEVYVMSTRMDEAEFVARIVRESTGTRVFFNESVYVEPNADSVPATRLFWHAENAADMREALTVIHDVAGTTTKVLDGVTYNGINLTLNATKWNTYRGGIAADFVANLPSGTHDSMTVFFGPDGDLRFIEARSSQINVEMVFYDWTDLTGAAVGEMADVRRGPHAAQERWDLPLDEATIRFIARLTR